METNDPMPIINRLIDRLEQETAKLGVRLQQPVIVPSRDGGPSYLQVMFIIEPAALDNRDPQAIADEQAVKEMLARSAEAEFEEKTKSVVEDVDKWLNE